MGERDVVRKALAARLTEGWKRLDDTVDELATLHGVTRAELVTRMDQVLSNGHPDDEDGASDTDTPPRS